jgi:hypothetical protein
MSDTCHICAESITDEDASVTCEHYDYSAQELELMGLEGYFESAFRCELATHVHCARHLVARRTCCAPPDLDEDRCVRHGGLGSGFLCLDCNRWHAVQCAAKGVVESLGGIHQGICIECDVAGRTDAAISSLGQLPVETLEAMTQALRALEPRDAQHVVGLLGAVSDLRSVRVPHASQPRVSLAIAVRAVQRAAQAARALESGLERAFLELVSEAGIDSEFVPQKVVPVDIASRDGRGRKAIVVTPDFAHRSLPYVVFLDGRVAHSGEQVLADDAEISAELAHLGFLVRRFRSAQLTPRFAVQTIETIHRDLNRLKSDAVRRTAL